MSKKNRFNRDWMLRLALAAVFLFHGIGKFAGPGSVGGFAQMSGLPVSIAFMVALAEVAGGLGIIIGGFNKPLISRLSGMALIPVMLGAIALVHWPRWSFVPSESHPMGGMEFQVVLLMIACWFAFAPSQAGRRDQ